MAISHFYPLYLLGFFVKFLHFKMQFDSFRFQKIDFNLTGMGEFVELPGLLNAIRAIIDSQVDDFNISFISAVKVQ